MNAHTTADEQDQQDERDQRPGPSWEGRTVAVTGAAGFFGSRLTRRLLDAGAHVRAFVRYRSDGGIGRLSGFGEHERLEIHRGDLRDEAGLPPLLEGADAVYHLGALVSVPYSRQDPGAYLSVNTLGTCRVLTTAQRMGVGRMIVVSTSEVYGTAQTEQITEDHPLVAQSPYSASKIAVEKVCESFHRAFGAPVVTVRPFNLYGPGQSRRAVIPSLAHQIVHQDVVRVGNTSASRDFNFVQDTVEAMQRIGLAPADRVVGQTFNIGSDVSVSIKEVADLLSELSGRHVVFETDESRLRPHGVEVLRLRADSSRLRGVIGPWPRTPLEEGLREVLDHERRSAASVGSFI
ncbi:GDP-mannose 4,6-dehydratase [Streptomyces sp. MST-110588]|uniref:GDP-mannose 4,6-dehydratase n=1 Tax=Streptomyces sp. MST-110588 TaxID=2833628 RepID=UPI001F5C725F|nr:GDP-mannose 4,6-dehydratase [Streptomyces sp. MST-110588]UNO39352.1 GDP-mannose 4,6-dehydratase [Streptomyces sp. MST-110588]